MKTLSGIGISKAKLFPEIDMVAKFIKNEYGLSSKVVYLIIVEALSLLWDSPLLARSADGQ
tara:strand:- start:1950 stop:2132 length:183 start_codon:yes stop_codon:yes gene_type:complete